MVVVVAAAVVVVVVVRGSVSVGITLETTQKTVITLETTLETVAPETAFFHGLRRRRPDRSPQRRTSTGAPRQRMGGTWRQKAR